MSQSEPADKESQKTEVGLLSADSKQDPVVSVVLPTRNEEVGIVECIRKIRRALEDVGVTGEIIVSDSSDDRTPELAREMGAIVVKPDGLGYGYAYRYAFEQARGEYVVIGDADTTYDFGELPTLLQPVIDGEADIVLGSRLAGEIEPGAMPFLHRTIGNPVLTAILNVLYDADVSDAHSGYRVLTREALERLDSTSDGMEFASEMLMEATQKDLDIEEVPIIYHEREGEATLNTFQDGWRHVKFMLVNAPGYLFNVPGLFFGFFGLLLMGLALFDIRPAGQPFGVHSMIAGSLLTVLGHQLVVFGLLTGIGGNPIRKQRDAVTGWFRNTITLERGIAIGVALAGVGTTAAIFLVYRWIASGFALLPNVFVAIAAFTLIVIGVQTVFSSFFASIIATGD